MALLDGVKVSMGGRDFVVPSLTLKSLKSLSSKLEILSSMGGIPTPDQIDAMVSVIHCAMVRNYPELSTQDVEELLDLSNLQTTFLSVMAASGLQRKQGEAESPQS